MTSMFETMAAPVWSLINSTLGDHVYFNDSTAAIDAAIVEDAKFANQTPDVIVQKKHIQVTVKDYGGEYYPGEDTITWKNRRYLLIDWPVRKAGMIKLECEFIDPIAEWPR